MAPCSKHFRVLINGQNFHLATNEGTRRMGFYTTRFVSARDYDHAETVAVNVIRDDDDLQLTVVNPRDDPPMVYVIEMHEVDALQPASGFTFYPDDAPDDEPHDATRPN